MLATIRNTAVIFSLAVAPFAAQAEVLVDGTTAKTSVRHSDLDLASPQGLATLDRRVRYAVRAVCGRSDGRDLAQTERVKACRQGAMAGAQGKVEVAIAEARGTTRLAQADGAPSIGKAAQ